jgi:ferredoxin
MKISVDWPLCDGNGNCAMEAPEVFALDENDKLSILVEEIPVALRPKVEAAVRACPKRALRLLAEPDS